MNFAVRFQLHKSGCTIEDTRPSVLASVYGLSTEETERDIQTAQTYVGAASERLKSKYDLSAWDKRVLFLGDSLTSDRFSFAHIIPKVLETECRDAAVSGACSTAFVASINYLLAEYNADLVHIMLGTNDIPVVGCSHPANIVSLEEYKRNISHLIECAGENRIVVLSSIPPVHTERSKVFLPNKVMSNEVIKRYNAALVEIAAEKKIVLNDTWSFLREADDFYEPDGVHLSPKAQEVFAERLMELFIQEEKKNG